MIFVKKDWFAIDLYEKDVIFVQLIMMLARDLVAKMILLHFIFVLDNIFLLPFNAHNYQINIALSKVFKLHYTADFFIREQPFEP